MEDIAPMIAVLGMFSSACFIVWVVLTARRRQQVLNAQRELQSKIIDRFGSVAELSQYLGSDAGRKLLDAAETDPNRPYAKIIGSVMVGIIMIAVGVGFLTMRGSFDLVDTIRGLTVTGTFFASLGAGFLLASTAAFLLSKTWGLLNGKKSADH